MTKAHFEKISNRYSISIVGHANYAEYDKDIVCAGVSALVQAFLCYIDNDDKATIIEKEVEDGKYYILVEGSEIESAYNMFLCGIGCIAMTYPNHVKII